MSRLRVTQVEPVEGVPALRATFSAKIQGVGRVKHCRYLVRHDGTSLVKGPVFADQHASGGRTVPVRFEREIADALLGLVETRLTRDTSR